MYLSKAAAEKYGRGQRRARGPSIVALLVQRQSLLVPSAGLLAEPIVADLLRPPYCLQDEQAPTLVAAWRAGGLLDIVAPFVP